MMCLNDIQLVHTQIDSTSLLPLSATEFNYSHDNYTSLYIFLTMADTPHQHRMLDYICSCRWKNCDMLFVVTIVSYEILV